MLYLIKLLTVSYVQVSECGWQPRRAPTLKNLYSICKNMHQWLKQDQRNICIVHCLVSKHTHTHTALFQQCYYINCPQSNYHTVVFVNKS